MVVSTRDFSATLDIGVTVPIESTSTGTVLRSALASSTETTRARGGPCTVALPPAMQRGFLRSQRRNSQRACQNY